MDFQKRFAIAHGVANWSFLTNHAGVLLYIVHDPGLRVRDIAVQTSGSPAA
jgi:hypothetical protein